LRSAKPFVATRNARGGLLVFAQVKVGSCKRLSGARMVASELRPKMAQHTGIRGGASMPSAKTIDVGRSL
jgi:hypothetical protein